MWSSVERALGTGFHAGQIGVRAVLRGKLGLFGFLSRFAAHDLFVALLNLRALTAPLRRGGFRVTCQIGSSRW